MGHPLISATNMARTWSGVGRGGWGLALCSCVQPCFGPPSSKQSKVLSELERAGDSAPSLHAAIKTQERVIAKLEALLAEATAKALEAEQLKAELVEAR